MTTSNVAIQYVPWRWKFGVHHVFSHTVVVRAWCLGPLEFHTWTVVRRGS